MSFIRFPSQLSKWIDFRAPWTNSCWSASFFTCQVRVFRFYQALFSLIKSSSPLLSPALSFSLSSPSLLYNLFFSLMKSLLLSYKISFSFFSFYFLCCLALTVTVGTPGPNPYNVRIYVWIYARWNARKECQNVCQTACQKKCENIIYAFARVGITQSKEFPGHFQNPQTFTGMARHLGFRAEAEPKSLRQSQGKLQVLFRL